MESDFSSMTFCQIVDKAITDNQLSKASHYLIKNANICKTDPSSIQRLLNFLSTYNMTDDINDCFLALIREGFMFDSNEYILPLKTLISVSRPQTQIKILQQLIMNSVVVDIALIQKALQSCFEQINQNPQSSTELEKLVLRVTKSILNDPSKYLTQDFVMYLVENFMNTGKIQNAEEILLNERISVNQYPDLWPQYIDHQCKKGNEMHVLALIDKLRTTSISPVINSLYNKVLERFIAYKGKTQIHKMLKIADHLIKLKIEFSYYNQLETLLQAYLLKDKAQFIEYIINLDYTLDHNVFNLVLNLILEQLDFETGLCMFELATENKLKGKDITTIDVSKNSLKYLLKYQLAKSKAVVWDIELERSEISSVITSQHSINKFKKLQQSLFPELKDFEPFKFFEIVQSPSDDDEEKLKEDAKSEYELL